MVLRGKPLRLTASTSSIALAIVVLGCEGATSSPTAAPPSLGAAAVSASPAAQSAQPSASSTSEIVGRVDYALCAGVIVDDLHKRWEIKWTGGFGWGASGGDITITGPDGSVIAHQGDRVAVSGSEGWYAEGKVLAKLDLDAIEPGSSTLGLKARRALVREWAVRHGLRLEPSYANGRATGWWVFRVSDGSPDEAKVDELSNLSEVNVAIRDFQGGFCGVGWEFTGTAATLLEPAAPPAESNASSPASMP